MADDSDEGRKDDPVPKKRGRYFWRAFRWSAIHVAVPLLTIGATAAGSGYYAVIHADDINAAVHQYRMDRDLEDAPRYEDILLQLRSRNAVHRRYDQMRELREGVEGICSEIDHVEGYRCARVYEFPRRDRTPLPDDISSDRIIDEVLGDAAD